MKNKPTKLLWRLRLPSARSLQFTPHTMLVLLPNDIACYDTNSGRYIFRQTAVSWSSYKALLRDKGLLLLRQVGTSVSLLEGFDPKSGKKLWELELPGVSSQATMRGELIAIPDKQTMRVYKIEPGNPPSLSTLHELSLPILKDTDTEYTSFLEPSQRFVGVASKQRSLIFSLHDGGVIWDSPHHLQWLTPWGWIAMQTNSYGLDLFDPAGNLLKTLHDPHVAKNNPDMNPINGRGYKVVTADEDQIALTSMYFARAWGFGSEGLYLFSRSANKMTTVKDRSNPCVYVGQDTIYLGDSGSIQALEKTHQTRWTMTQEDLKRWRLEKVNISYLEFFEGKLYGITQQEVFCLA